MLATVERELRAGPGQYAAEHARLRDLLGGDGTVRDQTIELARRIRAGEFDDRNREVLDAVRASVDGKAVAYLQLPGIAHPTKSKVDFGCMGKDEFFDDLKIWNAEPAKQAGLPPLPGGPGAGGGMVRDGHA